MRFNRSDENYVYGLIGKNIKKYRKMKGITQDELANLTTYSPSFIANIESSTYQTFSLGALWRIASALGVSLHDLCYDNEKLGQDSRSIEYICTSCSYDFDMPVEVIEVFEFIYKVSNNKKNYPSFTCPKCGGKIIPKKTKKSE